MRNILLLSMSTLPNDIEKDNYYQYQEGEIFAARSQLEPVTYMIDRERKKNGEKLDKIIILETTETQEVSDHKISAVGFYKERVGRFLEEVDYVDIQIDEMNPAKGIREATSAVWQEFEKQKNQQDQMNLWIDTQGGFRDVVMVFNAILSLLRDQGIEPKGIYSIRYSRENTREKPCPIINQTRNYDIFRFVAAMQEFMDFGKATGFKKYYGEENEFVQTLGGIADAIQMCQPQRFEEALKKFAAYLKSGKYLDVDPYLQIFAEYMKDDYGDLFEHPDNTVEQIKWCVRKEFYQQAMTIYIERMPKYYAEQKLVTLNINSEQKVQRGKNVYADAFYEGVFEELLRDENDEILNKLLTDLAGCEEINEGQWAQEYLKKIARLQNKDIKNAVERIIHNLEQCFDRNGEPTAIQLQNKGPKTVRGYINNVRDKQGKGQRYQLLYGTGMPKGTYEKKICAINAAKVKAPQLVKILEYYMAMKLLRNRMNHASEEDIEEDEQKAVTFLKSEQIDIGMQMKHGGVQIDFEKIGKLILEGISLEKEAKQNETLFDDFGSIAETGIYFSEQ